MRSASLTTDHEASAPVGMVDALIKRRAILFVGALAFAYAVGVVAWLSRNPILIGMDFAAYWRAAHESAAQAYAPGSRPPFPYPPTMLIWIAPFALIPFWLAYLSFMVASGAAFVLAIRPYLSREQILFALVIPPIINGISVGQCSIALAAALLWACSTSSAVKRGIAFGLIASVKPQLVVMAPIFMLIRRDWVAFCTAGLTWMATVIATFALFGLGAWRSWLASLSNFHTILAGRDRFGMALSPALTAKFLHLPSWPFMLVGFAVGLWLLGIARRSNAVVQCALIACASLLTAPYAMVYDLAPIIPFLVLEIWAGSMIAALAATGALAPVSLPLVAWGLRYARLFLGRATSSVSDQAGSAATQPSGCALGSETEVCADRG
jgi:hypothetical protein